MARCENCGNDYDKSFEVLMAGQRHTFDSFKCAIHASRPAANSAARASLDTDWKPMATCSAATIVPNMQE